ncbi:MAG: hypothetical protein HC805_00420 [Alkalinema sp. RL_2_19]|nr:hypothetical protein [Alkalinema sp. RL_2_19]
MECQQSEVNHANYWIEIEGDDRWEIYRRLQSLGLECQCQMGVPLKVRIDSPQDVLLGWSVMRSTAVQAGDRLHFAAILEACWHLEVHSY